MGKPAARITDLHTCPMFDGPKPHVGGPIIPACCPTVIIGGMPAARVSDHCTCVGPIDTIVQGSATVYIGGQPGARIGDFTAHGGIITTGFPTVLIGDGGGSAGGSGMVTAPGGGPSLASNQISNPALSENNTPGGAAGNTPGSTPYGKSIKIVGDSQFQNDTLAALGEIASTPTGKRMLDDLEASGKTVTIQPTTGGNGVSGLSRRAFSKSDGSPGEGSDSVLSFNSKSTTIGNQPWSTRPPAIGLAHELVHSTHAARGEIVVAPVPNDSKPNPADPKTFATEKQEEVRTVGIHPYENEPYSENKIRSEWKPKQPPRDWY